MNGIIQLIFDWIFKGKEQFTENDFPRDYQQTGEEKTPATEFYHPWLRDPNSNVRSNKDRLNHIRNISDISDGSIDRYLDS